MLQRCLLVTAGAAVFGVVELRLARHSPAEFWFANSCAAWLLIAFVAGALTVRWLESVWLGTLATMVALASFYVVAAHVDAEGLEFTARKAMWFALGLASGPVCGLIGHCWRATASRWAALTIAAPFCLEPFAWVWHRGYLPGPNEAWKAEMLLGVLLLGALLARVPDRPDAVL